ncbi:MAG: hypothetical protein D3922_09180 [Candidatus Electrothrix sp. AR1]|nr:hypothetical protein [Candidatus Electrothrix sp. AR1]
MFSFFPEKGSSSYYSVQPFFEPGPFGADTSVETWKESVSGTGDFSGRKVARGNRVVIGKTALQTEKTIVDPYGQKLKKIFTIGCVYKASAADEDVEQDCERFFQSVDFIDK